MRFKKLISAFLAAAFCVSLAGMAFAEKLTKVPTAWMDEHETFLIWYAKEKGWDKEAGLDIDIQYFGSGMDILNALPSGSWVFAGMGGVPAMMGYLRYGTSVIAIGNDESMTNSVLVRPDSPIAKVKGYNKDFPEVLGSPDTVKGKTFLTTTVSSAHYGLSSWLKVLGLTDKDITIKNMDQAQALAAFDNGIGDGVALWAPHMYAGRKTHPVYNREEQLALFDTSKGMSTAQKWQSDIAKFFASVGSINKDELKKVENGAYATDKYLKLVKTPIPSYK